MKGNTGIPNVGAPPQQGGGRLNMKLSDLTEVKCESCGGNVFAETFMLRSVSPILTGAPKKMMLPVPVISCVKCNHVNLEFLPDMETIV